jgi:hypothetical protein
MFAKPAQHEHLAIRLVLERASKRQGLRWGHVLACPRTGGFRILEWWRTVRRDVLVDGGGGGDLLLKTQPLWGSTEVDLCVEAE